MVIRSSEASRPLHELAQVERHAGVRELAAYAVQVRAPVASRTLGVDHDQIGHRGVFASSMAASSAASPSGLGTYPTTTVAMAATLPPVEDACDGARSAAGCAA